MSTCTFYVRQFRRRVATSAMLCLMASLPAAWLVSDLGGQGGTMADVIASWSFWLFLAGVSLGTAAYELNSRLARHDVLRGKKVSIAGAAAALFEAVVVVGTAAALGQACNDTAWQDPLVLAVVLAIAVGALVMGPRAFWGWSRERVSARARG